MEKWMGRLTTSETALALRVTEQTVRKYIEEGNLPAKRLPNGRFLIDVSDVEALLKPTAKK